MGRPQYDYWQVTVYSAHRLRRLAWFISFIYFTVRCERLNLQIFDYFFKTQCLSFRYWYALFQIILFFPIPHPVGHDVGEVGVVDGEGSDGLRAVALRHSNGNLRPNELWGNVVYVLYLHIEDTGT